MDSVSRAGSDVDLSQDSLAARPKETADAHVVELNQDLSTRNICLVGLVTTFVISIPILVCGIYLLHSGNLRTVGGSPISRRLIPLSLNIGITL
jgi:hypothetical protein